jgi:hypothetical protein
MGGRGKRGLDYKRIVVFLSMVEGINGIRGSSFGESGENERSTSEVGMAGTHGGMMVEGR